MAFGPRLVLAMDVVSFGLSALLLAVGVRARPPAGQRLLRIPPLRETAAGLGRVFRPGTTRSIAAVVLMAAASSIVPEGLAAAWAAGASVDDAVRGVYQGLLMAAGPMGFLAGGIVARRLTPPARDRLIRPLAVLSAVALVPMSFIPPMPLVVALVAFSGVCQGALLPTLNGKFVALVSPGFRARAYGAVQIGMQLSQFAGVVVAGLLADWLFLPVAVGLWGIAGALVMGLLAWHWPSPVRFLVDSVAAAAPQPDVPRAEPEGASARTLAAYNRDAGERAMSYAHPLLAAVFIAAADRLGDVPPATGREAQLLVREWAVFDRNQRRLRWARVAYLLNLPLGKDAAANFAAARMAERVRRLGEAMDTYLSRSGGPHV